MIGATDTLKVDGVLSANGDDGAADPENATAAGSGGGMFLAAGTIAGAGTISADGGSRAGDAGGGGGGGRIAGYYTHKTFSGQAHAYGGRQTDVSRYGGSGNVNSFPGGAGTVFWQGAGEPKDGGTLIVAGDSATLWPPPGETPIKASWSSPDRTLIVENGARAEIESGAYQTITVQHGGVITLPLNMTVHGGGSIVLAPGPQTMMLKADTITVDPTSRIDVSAHGDAGGDNSGSAAGNGKTPGTRGAGESYGSWGGSHGGIGGNVPGSDAISWDGTVPADKLGGTAYDDPTNPLQVGGGSGGSSYGTNGGAVGGGVLQLSATTLNLAGRLIANGQPNLLPTPDFPSIFAGLAASGAGGSVNLRVHTLTGGGSIEADGGNTCVLIAALLISSQAGCGEAGSQGAGGGGRIAIRYTDTKSWTGKVHAYGGYNVEYLHEHPTAIQVGRAGPGTIFWLAAGQPADGGKLVIDGGGPTTDRRAGTPLGAKVNGAHRTLIITGGAVAYGKNLKVANLELLHGSVLTTQPGGHTLSIAATHLTVDASSRIDLTGRGDAGDSNAANYPADGRGVSPGSRPSTHGAGGSHGGAGGAVQFSVPGPTYGSADNPTLPGAGGAGGDGQGGPGGGVLFIQAGVLMLNGEMSVEGLATDGPTVHDLTHQDFLGAGAGGSINLHVGIWSGHGTLSANGGNACLPQSMIVGGNTYSGCGNSGYGAGGGGRIAVTYKSDAGWRGKAQAAGGANLGLSGADARTAHGGKGTVVTKKST